MSIITKFIVGSPWDMPALLFISRATARVEIMQDEVSDLSNQFIVVYSDDEPVGYARVTSKGVRPVSFQGKTAIRIADFGILKEFDDDAARTALLEKCLSICGIYQIIWIGESTESPYLNFFESYGFKRIDLHEFESASVYLIKS